VYTVEFGRCESDPQSYDLGVLDCWVRYPRKYEQACAYANEMMSWKKRCESIA